MTARYQDVTTHPLIANLCVEFANEVYEEMCSRSNKLFKAQHSRKDFVQQCAPTLVQEARQTLAMMLQDPDLPQISKDEIFEALLLHNSLPKNGVSYVRR